MSIQNIYGSIATSQTSDVSTIGQTTQTPSSIPPPAMGGAESATISTPGQFFSELQQLSQSDPTKFKQVASQLATSFQNAASQASGPDAKMLTNLANRFSEAAQTGTLQPPQAPQNAAQAGGAGAGGGAHHHHHHHGGGGGGGGSSAMNQAFQAAMSILTQATQGSTSTTTTASTPPTT